MDIYFLFVVILFALAASDLVVGVSNDAVNFLNSAIGSKVGKRWLIMGVASLGILFGVLFSSGMMEVARKGIFNPELFTFAHVMVIFLAVMLTDILLLDLFNTLGMPTSTTVSIVFELLGAAVAVSTFHLIQTGESLSELVNYINTSKAILIISGIFLSIFVAFSAGVIAQFISRLMFSFRYKERLNSVGPWWTGIAMTILSYFIIIKGLKGSVFFNNDFNNWVQANNYWLVIANLIFWTALSFGLQKYTKINILKVLVFVGTFSLALAFASNDLVNFIGVPIAGFQSFMAWKGSGIGADSFMMDALGGKVPTPMIILVLAAAVMIITLWKSKKARTVTATEINLSRQEEGNERFKPNWLARTFVNLNQKLINYVFALLPEKMKHKIKKNYDRNNLKNEAKGASFDMVRASVNLTIASMLIAIATSYKMPLSTTYVSFMVAMGTSLADKAWGNGTAAHRVAGVLNVIGGWFMTAIIAFSISAFFATLIFSWDLAGLTIVILLVAAILFLSYRHHSRQQQEVENEPEQGIVNG
ncbi:inorganic phosphate transporter [Reichenbachiella ulvae]|uniref:Phosphate transporter n=1 Tax=Reichenbachiella ulvae TaxID=2980104 RepID=A0ABT3CS59_9BACT|nr:inorganic phosphate transporter [Reichenbachiella ulvae]MCV9386393.1 inorganic phosphate transporter [Reichenbachiella ulvae]